ncbi:MAG: FAD:protein FMN transferase [Sarcina sp.]
MKSRKKLAGLFIIPVFLLTMVAGCSNEKVEEKNKEKLSKTEVLMGTSVKVTLYEGGSEKILNKAFDRVKELEEILSINKLGTEIDKVNENSGEKPVKVSDDSFTIIEKAVDYSEKSSGAYDLTIGPLVKLWSIGLPEAKVPSEIEIKEALGKIDYKKVKLNEESKEVFLEDKGMMLDLGSIAKGYTADELAKLLKEQLVTKAIIDIGGNIYAVGEKAEGKDWTIGIQNPFTDRGEALGSITVKDKSIVTSGIYERYIEEDGKKYHHILNPETGYPFEGDIAGVTLVTDKSIDGDALSTLIFTKGVKEGIEFVKNIDSVEAIFITKDKKIYLTDGLKENFKLIDEEFLVEN